MKLKKNCFNGFKSKLLDNSYKNIKKTYFLFPYSNNHYFFICLNMIIIINHMYEKNSLF